MKELKAKDKPRGSQMGGEEEAVPCRGTRVMVRYEKNLKTMNLWVG